MTRERVLVAMSGGVDSSVAAARLLEEGHDVTGVTLKLWGGESDSGCCSVADVEDARRVAAQLGIPHYVFDFTDDFTTAVVDPYVDAHTQGRTPNPCVDCNRTMKFGRLLDRALTMGFDSVATGHHARLVTDAHGNPAIARGADPAKDQSYVLAILTARELAHARFPVGEMTKAEVRAEAARLGLRTATKPESMEVCFITRGNRQAFLDARTRPAPGPIVTTDGVPVGAHAGITRFTIGQRRGLGVATGDRRFVVDVDATTATVTIGDRTDLLRAEAPVTDVVFASTPVPAGTPVEVQVRAHGAARPARWEGDRVVWETPEPRVAPGQVVALYRDDVVLGAGIAA